MIEPSAVGLWRRSWTSAGRRLRIVTDATGRIVSRGYVVTDHDPGDEQDAPPRGWCAPEVAA